MTPTYKKDIKARACHEPDFLYEPQKSAEYEKECELHKRISKILDNVYELNALAGNCPFPLFNIIPYEPSSEGDKPQLFRYRKEIAEAFALQIMLEETIRAQLFVAPFYGIFTERTVSKLEKLLEAKRYKAFSKYYISLLSKFDKPNPFLDGDIVGPIAKAPDADSAISNSMNLKHYCEPSYEPMLKMLNRIDFSQALSNLPEPVDLSHFKTVYKKRA